MKIKNRSWSPLTITLPEGRSMTLSGRGSDYISEADFNSPQCQQLYKNRSIFVLPEKRASAAALKEAENMGEENVTKDEEDDQATEPSGEEAATESEAEEDAAKSSKSKKKQ